MVLGTYCFKVSWLFGFISSLQTPIKFLRSESFLLITNVMAVLVTLKWAFFLCRGLSHVSKIAVRSATVSLYCFPSFVAFTS